MDASFIAGLVLGVCLGSGAIALLAIYWMR
jgi:hypothetical protein